MSQAQEHHLTCDVLVAGGGPAGVCAAISAARSGARTVLCHDRPVLGGNASSEVRMHIVGADLSGHRGEELATEAREGGLIEEIRLANCVRNPQRSPSVFDLILYEKCRAEPMLTLLLNTAVVGAETDGRCIKRVLADRASTQDHFTIEARAFVDATGDGRLGYEAGAPFVEGREAASEHGESLAPLAADRFRLGSTLMFQARRHDRPMPFSPPSWARRFSEEDLRLRPHAAATGPGDLDLEYGYWWVEWGGHLDTIKDNETIRDELLAIVLGVWDHVKNGGDHGADNWALEWFGFLPGKRESRRFVGQATLTERDVLGSTEFADAIAYGGWFIDTHPPLGVDAVNEPPCVQHAVPHLYDIPLRACVSRAVGNLLFAGRNISATHVAFASTRVMATCAVVGQGVGVAAAYAALNDIQPAALANDAAAIDAIQQRLLCDDAFLIGRTNHDPADLARSAAASASSEQPQGAAQSVVRGPTRSVHGPGGAPRERAVTGAHRWMSEAAAGLPAWIELCWGAPIAPDRMQLIFDTGLHRLLTFTLADGYAAKMEWGRMPRECVRDFSVDAALRGAWRPVVRIAENVERRCVVRLDRCPLDALRVTVHATHGIDHARICELRVIADESRN